MATNPPLQTNRLRIAFVVHDYNRHAGHSRYVAELATRFKRDHDVHIFANTFEESDPSELTFHKVPALRMSQIATVLSFILPATVLVRGQYDIVHAQGLCGLRHDVATMHFCVPSWYDALARVGVEAGWKGRLFRLLVTPWEGWALTARRTRKIIAISKLTRGDLASYYHRNEGVEVVYHGVDTTTFHPSNRERYRAAVRAELGLPPEACVALFVGNLAKGAGIAIRATARVPEVQLLIVSGSNPAADQAVAQSEGAADRIRFLPHSREIERYFAAADVFLFPTIYEPYGMVISEAMAAGLPVITSKSAGAAELISHGVDGWLVDPPWDVDQFAVGLAELAADTSRREEMGRIARRTIEPFTWDRAAEQTLAVYRQLVTR
jgi:UDP-glucose:(heptosyl)LPS alpha-1,3-glucosyltransferase